MEQTKKALTAAEILAAMTKGEWQATTYRKEFSMIRNNDEYICDFNASIESEEKCSINAKAICNAVNSTYLSRIDPLAIPELIEAVKQGLSMMEQTLIYRENNNLTNGNIFLDSAIKNAKSALEKAIIK